MLNDKDYEDFKKISEKEGINYESELEMKQSADNLVQFVDLLLEMSKEQLGWERRLEKEPRGFALPSEGRSCSLCSQSINGEVWYDKWGIKCMNCHKAYIKHIIPGYVFKDRKNEKHITTSTLSWKMNIHSQTINKLIRQGKIKVRQVPQGPSIILRRENLNLTEVIADEKQSKSGLKKKQA